MQIASIVLTGAALLLAGVFASKLSSRFGVPALLLFLVIGMLAGSEGPGGIPFDAPDMAMLIGSIALGLILFDGGLQTDVRGLDRRLIARGSLLATLGVMLTAGVIAAFAVGILGLGWLDGLLLGAILSSTDAAAVFSVLRARGVGLPKRLRELIEFESASNDPTAVFLTVAMIALAEGTLARPGLLPLLYVFRIAGGAVLGWGSGLALTWLLDRIDLEHDGLYPVLTLGAVGLIFGLGELLGTSGFMAVYMAGLVMSPRVFVHRNSLKRFHEGLAWLMQITLFLILGLQVFPSHLLDQAAVSLAIAVALIVVARPIAVFSCLIASGLSIRERILVSWVGLRGAAPIILATFPLVAGLPSSELIFNTVFFAVVISVLVQGPTVGFVARLLGIAEPATPVARAPIEISPSSSHSLDIQRLEVQPGSEADGAMLLKIGGEGRPLVVLVRREGHLFPPTGATKLGAGDELYVLGSEDSVEEMRLLVQ